MPNLFRSNQLYLLVALLLLGMTLIACKGPSTNLSQNSSAGTATTFPTDTGVVAATPTQPPGRVILLASADALPSQVEQTQAALTTLTGQMGLLFESRPKLETQDLTPDVRLVVILPPAEESVAQIPAWIAAASTAQFLVISIDNLPSAPNLHVLGPQGARPDQQGFIAGYLAAVVTWDWRVGVITVSNTSAGKAAGQAFMNGVVYFCGLCRPSYPPFLQYPIYAEVSAGAGQNEWQPIAEMLIQNAVKTVYVAPGAGDETLLAYLAQAGVNLIGSQPGPQALRNQWVASIHADPIPLIQKLWPDLISGSAEAILPIPITFSEANPTLFSPGRQSYAQKTLDELLVGYIDSGVDPLTGEKK
ncbi:MAG: hypothetical protein MUO64_22415 [Anaerolineales bacterium]|nr:hypothetical protein [Anaerolineales bacterium]